MQRNVDIGFRHRIALNDDDGILRRQRRGHQQRGQELAGDAAVRPRRCRPENRRAGAAVDNVPAPDSRSSAALTQGIHQMADRTLFHPRFAGQHDIVAAKATEPPPADASRYRRCQGTAPAPRAERNGPPLPVTSQRVRSAEQGILNPQRTQGIQHMAHIVAVQQVGQTPSCRGPGQPAAARGWRRFSNLAGSRCPLRVRWVVTSGIPSNFTLKQTE